MTVQEVLHQVAVNEAINLGLLAGGVILLGVYWAYVMERWTWIPRKRQRRGFGERF